MLYNFLFSDVTEMARKLWVNPFFLKELSQNGTGSNTADTSLYIEDYGAVGDGVTNDAAAIQAAIDALPTRGGEIRLGNKTYLTNTQINVTKPVKFVGQGWSYLAFYTGQQDTTQTKILCTSGTIDLFVVSSDGVIFEDMHIYNSHTLPTAGSGIKIMPNNQGQPSAFFRMRNVNIDGFYVDLDSRACQMGHIEGCFISSPVTYGIRMEDTVNQDAGDWTIVGGQIIAHRRASTAGIYQKGAGGLKMLGVKFNGTPSAGRAFQYGYLADFTGAVTSILKFDACSIENFTTGGIKILGSSEFKTLSINGCDFASYTGNNIYHIDLSTIKSVNLVGNTFNLTGSEIPIKLTTIANVNSLNTYQKDGADYTGTRIFQTSVTKLLDLNDPTIYGTSTATTVFSAAFGGSAGAAPAAETGTINSYTSVEQNGTGGLRLVSGQTSGSLIYNSQNNVKTKVTITTLPTAGTQLIYVQQRYVDTNNRLVFALSYNGSSWYVQIYSRVNGVETTLLTGNTNVTVTSGSVLVAETTSSGFAKVYIEGGTVFSVSNPHPTVGSPLTSVVLGTASVLDKVEEFTN